MNDDTCEDDKNLPQEPDSTTTDTKVSFTFESITFSDGTTISLKPTAILLFLLVQIMRGRALLCANLRIMHGIMSRYRC